MDFFNKAASQITELFRSMTPGARILASLLLAVIVVSLVFLFRFEVSGGDEYLYNATVFSSADLLEIEKIFSRDARLTNYDIVGGRVRIDRNKRLLYHAALADAGFVPDSPNRVLEKAYDGIGPWDRHDIASRRINTAEDKQLSMLISNMAGIHRANVKIHEHKTGAFHNHTQISALVSVRANSDGHLSESQVKSIRAAVRAAHAALELQDIAVVDENRGYTWAGGADGRLPSDDPYIANKNKYEEVWQNKIAGMLDWVTGVRVGVDVELEPEMDVQMVKVTRDPRAFNSKQRTTTSESTNRSSNPAARPGAPANGVGNQAVRIDDRPSDESTETEQTEDIESLTTSHEQVTSARPSLTPKVVKASILVPISHVISEWRKENPPAEGEEPTEPTANDLLPVEENVRTLIENTVVNMLPDKPAGVSKWDPVQVQFFADVPPPALTPPSVADKATTWLAGHWETLGLIGVGLISLLILRSMVKVPEPEPAAADAADAGAAGGDGMQVVGADAGAADEEDDEEESEESKGFKSTGPNLREDLSSLVKEDPDAAANVLRNWIGDAA